MQCVVPCAVREPAEQVLGRALQIMLACYQDYMYDRDKGASLYLSATCLAYVVCVMVKIPPVVVDKLLKFVSMSLILTNINQSSAENKVDGDVVKYFAELK